MRQEFRDRVILPVLIPVGLFGLIALLAVGFGMMLLYSPMVVSGTIAIVVAAGILGAFGLATAHSELPRLKGAVIAGAGVVPLLIGGLVATGVITTTAERVVDREPHQGVPPGAAELVAEDSTWEQTELTLPEVGEVAVVLVNKDDGIPHNMSIYPLRGRQPDLDNVVFEGPRVDGVAQQIYTFPAPEEPGAYYYQCDFHPTTMTGTVTFEGEGEGGAGADHAAP